MTGRWIWAILLNGRNLWIYPKIAFNSIIFQFLNLMIYPINWVYKRGRPFKGMRVAGRKALPHFTPDP